MIYNTWQAGILNEKATKVYLSRNFRMQVRIAWKLKSSKITAVRKVGVYLLDRTTKKLRKANV